MVFCNVVRLSCPAQTCIQKGTLFTLKWCLILQRFPVLLFLFWFSCCYCHRSCRLRYRRGGSVFATATWFQAGKMSLTRESNVAECIKRRLIKMCLKFNRSVVRLGLTFLVSCRRFSQFMTLRHKVWTRRYCWAGRGAGDAGDFSETPTFHLWRPCDCEILMKFCKYCSKSIKIYFWKQGIPKDCQASTELATASTLLAPGTGEPWVMWCGLWVYEGSNDSQVCACMSIAYHLFFWLI